MEWIDFNRSLCGLVGCVDGKGGWGQRGKGGRYKKAEREGHTAGEITTGGEGFWGTAAVIVVGLYAGLLAISRDSRRTCLDLHRHAPGQTRCVPFCIFVIPSMPLIKNNTKKTIACFSLKTLRGVK
jgi:hypothetical protein